MIIDSVTYSVKEASYILGVSLGKMYQLIRENNIPNIKLGKCYLIPKQQFIDFINNSVQGGNI